MTGASRSNNLRQNARRAHRKWASEPAPATPATHLDMAPIAGCRPWARS